MCKNDKEHPACFLFVYGTLRKWVENDMALYLSMNGEFIGHGKVHGELFDIGDYPGLLLNADAPPVYGDIYKIDCTLLAILDEYEEISESPESEYKRVVISVSMAEKSYECITYLYNKPVSSAHKIASGDYLAYLQIKKKNRVSNYSLD